ncbi:MAG: hypothetical protein F6K09_26200 [Merismopedia sp. SIO2A8]|nr:hypothetical protein [Merismopedia sp. SIO2A8]
MKYFFLLDGWTIGRVWEFGGLWNEVAWQRPPEIERTNLQIIENGEPLWLYRVEEAVLMVEVLPDANHPSQPDPQNIGQVVLKRLISAEQAIERLNSSKSLALCTS